MERPAPRPQRRPGTLRGETAAFRRPPAIDIRSPPVLAPPAFPLPTPSAEPHEKTRSCRRHRRRRPDRLLPAVSHRLGPDAGQDQPVDPAAARAAARQGAGGPQGRDDGARGLRVPAARRHGRHRRPEGRFQGRRFALLVGAQAARPRHGAQGPADGEREDLHRAGQGARRGRDRATSGCWWSATRRTPTPTSR